MPSPSKSRRRERPKRRRPGWREVSDEFWEKIKPLIPPDRLSPKGGRRPIDHRQVFNAILYVLRTGCQWKMIPRPYCSGSTAHRHFQAWVRANVFGKMWTLCLKEYDDLKGIDWEWQVLDSATVSAPVKGGISQGKTPPIAESSGPNDTCSWMATAFLSA